jgi:hypothetical protein
MSLNNDSSAEESYELLAKGPSLLWSKNWVMYIHIKLFVKYTFDWAPVAHTCNPSDSGDRDQEDLV